jgi:tetratricopeptide (TPR) repeat protein
MSGITGLPHAFIVARDGRVAWHGSPHIGMAPALSDLLAGTYRPERYQKLNKLRRQLAFAIKAHDAPKAMACFDQMIATVPEDAWAHQNRASILAKQDKMRETRDAYLAMGRSCTSDPDALAEAARRLATTRYLHLRDMPAALAFAERAAEITDRRDLKVLRTLARVHYELGHVAKAAEVQARAVSIAPEGEQALLRATLLFYQREAQRRAADPHAK